MQAGPMGDLHEPPFRGGGGVAISPLSGGGPVEERRKPNNINNVGGYMFECGMV